jgi:hypothetical protein
MMCSGCADWVTPDLMESFKSNQALSRGFSNPKCMAAMQLLQSDPKEAQRRFGSDPEVSGFLREFGKLMAGHFEALGAQQQSQQQPGEGRGTSSGGGSSAAPSGSTGEAGIRVGSSSTSSGAGGAGPGIQELGPLHAQALQRKR